jgi:hypothetical protein
MDTRLAAYLRAIAPRREPMSERKACWWQWNLENPHVYRLFEQFTYEAIGFGSIRLSARLVADRVRWEGAMSTTGIDVKFRNDFIAYYARLFMERHPEHRGLFQTKRMKDEFDGPAA